jgi:hypothetical protein
MPISRRNLLRRFGASAAASAASLRVHGRCLCEVLQPSHVGRPAGPIRLDRNENAYGPSEKAIAAMCEGTSLANRYPGSECDDLANRIARMHGVGPEQMVLGCGRQLLAPNPIFLRSRPTGRLQLRNRWRRRSQRKVGRSNQPVPLGCRHCVKYILPKKKFAG